MSHPFFYHPFIADQFTTLDETTSKHVAQVLRMKVGDRLYLTDGRGQKVLTRISAIQKREVVVGVETIEKIKAYEKQTTIAMGVLKNASRMEWFIEKATEMGTSNIILLQTDRTEKNKIRTDRLQNIAISAMLQSRQCWLPVITHLSWAVFLENRSEQKKYIAHCMDAPKSAIQALQQPADSIVVAIGPEGDFTKDEITAATAKQFIPVSLGDKRLRTETAAMVAATYINLG